jgi:hypothetical protein
LKELNWWRILCTLFQQRILPFVACCLEVSKEDGTMRLLVMMLAAAVAGAACDRARATEVAEASPAPAAAEAKPSGDAELARASSREVTIPAGTRLPIVLDSNVGSDTSRIEDAVHAHLTQPIKVHGATVLPAGSRVSGVVTDATRSGRVKGRAHVAVRFDTLTPRGDDERYTIRTTPVGRTAPGTKKKDALEIGAPAAGGALIGAILGGKKGAAIGTAAGGGAGTAVVLSTRGREIHLPKGAPLMLRLSQPVTVRVKG